MSRTTVLILLLATCMSAGSSVFTAGDLKGDTTPSAKLRKVRAKK